MFSWLESEILELPETDFLVLSAVLVLLLIYLCFYAHGTFKRFRFMDGTATSKIGSAAQGHVELKGLAEWMPNDAIYSPFSNSRCVWFHSTIDERSHSGKRSTWTNISDDRSGHLFQLIDDSGFCVIDPDEARIVPESERTWYGNSTESRSKIPVTAPWLHLGVAKYRFRERLISPASQLYALGWFSTIRNNLSEESISKQVEDQIKQWKLQPERYLREYDLDQNGKIQKDEWKVIRSVARKQVLARINRETREHHIMSKPKDKHQPYILSAVAEEDLLTSKKWKAYSSVVGAFLIFSALVVMFSARSPFPV